MSSSFDSLLLANFSKASWISLRVYGTPLQQNRLDAVQFRLISAAPCPAEAAEPFLTQNVGAKVS